MGDFGFKELIVVLVIILLLFGAKKVPEIMKNFGQGVKEFKKAAKEISSDDETPAKTASAPPAPAAKEAPPSDKQA